MKISRTVKRNLLLKIKQVRFFSGYAVTTGTSMRKYIIFFISELLPSSINSNVKNVSHGGGEAMISTCSV